MVKLPWFIPKYRDVLDFEVDLSSNEDKDVIIKEYRDEAHRPWYKFFDEYEYRAPKSKRTQKWWRYRWFDQSYSPQEKKLLIKLDATVAVYALLGYWVKYLDSANLNNAYVSGLKEDIGMKGNDLIDTQVLFLVGNIIFELPWLFLLPRVPIPYVLFGSEFIWSLFTLVTYKVQNPQTLKAFRFIIGASEAAFFPVFHYCALQWYKPHEIGLIGAIFYCGQFIGVLTSGLLQGAASTIRNGGLSGWQWMFIIDGIISFGVALLSLFLQPGTPSKCYLIWLTDDEIRLARSRMKENGTDMSHLPKAFFNKSTWKKILLSWHFWLMSVIQMCGFNTNSALTGSFALWLKSLDRYDTKKLNDLTTIPPALGVLWVFIVCIGADVTGMRFGAIFFSFIMNFVSNIILAIWDVPEKAKWAGFSLAYWSWSQSLVFNPLISDILRHDANQKAIEWMIVYICGLQSNAWISRLVFPTTDAPRFSKGFLSCAIFSLAFNALLIVAYWFYKRDERANALSNGIYIYNSTKGEKPPQVLDRNEGSKTENKDSKDGKVYETVSISSST